MISIEADPTQPRQCIGNNTRFVVVIVVVARCCAFIQITLSNPKEGEGGGGVESDGDVVIGATAGTQWGIESNAMFGIVYTIQMILLFVDL